VDPLLKILSSIDTGHPVEVKGLTTEALVYFCTETTKPMCVFLNQNTLEETMVMLKDKPLKEASFILKKAEDFGVFENFYQKLSNISIQYINTGQKTKLCFIDERLQKAPLFSNTKTRPLLINSLCDYDNLINGLEKINFIQKDYPFDTPGSFYINGGIIDVKPFDTKENYRISFLENECKVYTVNKNTNTIVAQVQKVALFPKSFEKTIPPIDLFQETHMVSKYSSGSLFLGKKPLKHINTNLKVVDFQGFIKKQSKNCFYFNFNSEVGFLYKNNLFLPSWFKEKNISRDIAKQRPSIDGAGALIIGSIYVHEDFGLCQFTGMYSEIKKEKICLRFLDGSVKLDVFYVSKLSFFSNESNTKLSYLNKPGLWKRQKLRAQKAAEDYVAHIAKSYSKREAISSKPLNVNDPVIDVFVKGFKHRDTVDQKKCWEDILLDFSMARPMNRLVCGDVGFGKTEIAIRAAFVSVINGGSVIVLAPTTILANQLYHSFVSRVDSFGVKVGLLSSISSEKTKTISSFLNKKTDIVVGTSSILFKPEILKNCNLFIVDEEHRFGVKDKEFVFSLNPAVNFLSLSATPIPRSLQLSLSNVRELSLINTPPVERKPIISFVHFFDLKIISNSILKEVNRGGQVFFVDNSVENLKKTIVQLKKRLPFLTFGLIYSKMNKKALLSSMNDFIFGKTQVLLSTSIIESGIDIGLANTIIINNAHMFGLSQLYQLRGRVGRSTSQAFAWFLIPQKNQTNDSKKRIKTILKNTSLGSGYNIALSDLDIRGGGALFGYRQSGDGGVGFEFYTKLIGLASSSKKNKPCIVNISNTDLSSDIGDEGKRGYYYKSVFETCSVSGLRQLKKDFISIYGAVPKNFLNLLHSREVAIKASEKNVEKIFCANNWTTIIFYSFKNNNLVSLIDFISSFFAEKNIPFVFLNSKKQFSFKYKNVFENDYILLLSFINKLSI